MLNSHYIFNICTRVIVLICFRAEIRGGRADFFLRGLCLQIKKDSLHLVFSIDPCMFRGELC